MFAEVSQTNFQAGENRRRVWCENFFLSLALPVEYERRKTPRAKCIDRHKVSKKKTK